jgi:acyl-CoA thioester hydrolase
MNPMPTYDEVMCLPPVVTATVTADFIDANGHMNIRHYLELDASATTLLVESLGIDDAYRAERRMGVFTAEHHLFYLSELHEGDALSVHLRVIARSDKVVHLMAFLLDQTRRRLANTLELTLVHVNMDSRRPVPMPPELAEGFDRHIDSDRSIPWPAPTCGVMGIQRRTARTAEPAGA